MLFIALQPFSLHSSLLLYCFLSPNNNDYHNHHHDHCSAPIVQCIYFTNGLHCNWTITPLSVVKSIHQCPITSYYCPIVLIKGGHSVVQAWVLGDCQEGFGIEGRMPTHQDRKDKGEDWKEPSTLQHGNARAADGGMAPWPALHRHWEMSLLTLAGNAETSKMETRVRFVSFITSDNCKMIVIIWNYFKKLNVNIKNNSIFNKFLNSHHYY